MTKRSIIEEIATIQPRTPIPKSRSSDSSRVVGRMVHRGDSLQFTVFRTIRKSTLATQGGCDKIEFERAYRRLQSVEISRKCLQNLYTGAKEKFRVTSRP